MPVCAQVYVPTQELLVDPSVTDLSTCAYVLETPQEYREGWHALGDMTVDDASVIGSYVALVWAIAFGFRLVRRAIDVDPVRDDGGA